MGEVIIVGGGLAGLSAAFRLARAGRRVRLFEARPHLGGRTASWIEDGMKVESGLHRVLGFCMHLPRLMRSAGIDLEQAIIWEDEIEIRLPNGRRAVYGASLPRRPLETIWSLAGIGVSSISPRCPQRRSSSSSKDRLPPSTGRRPLPREPRSPRFPSSRGQPSDIFQDGFR
jgi:uncharacterized protein with NAD-binding domain and iron-sulfur cluster